MSERLELTVAIVTWHSDRARLAATLASLARACERLRERADARIRLVVLDNGAVSAPLGEVPLEPAAGRVFDVVEHHALERNLGFGGAHNRMLALGCGEYHLVLNPDVELDREALLLGIEYLQLHAEASAAVPDGRAEDGTPLYLAKAEPSLFVLLLRALAPRARSKARAAYELHAICALGEPAEVPLASGCCMLLRARNFAEVGGFAPEYFLYFEDFDLSKRLARVGPLVYLPRMRIVHHGGDAARKGLRHIAYFCRSALRYFSRWGWRLL